MDEKIYHDAQGFLKNDIGIPILDEKKQIIYFTNNHESLFLRKNNHEHHEI